VTAYALGRGVFVWLPLLTLGAPPAVVVWQFIAVTITGLAAHANIAYRIPALAHRLAVTPEFHRVHHAADPRLGNANFAAVLPLWDMLFGTHVDPLKVEVTDAGIPNDPVPRDFVAELRWPFAATKPTAETKPTAIGNEATEPTKYNEDNSSFR
jgi:sterol desaturase/sphingolipid hydroxylase (fatty acid hydroxylase superfamily)